MSLSRISNMGGGSSTGSGITKYARGQTLVVAASNSRDVTNYDYLCTGTNDHTTINTAIAALPSGGGKVVLLEGTFNLGGAISFTIPYTALEGQGINTILSVNNAVNAYAIVYNPAASVRMDGCSVRNLKILCNGANQTIEGGGIDAFGAAFNLFQFLWIDTPWRNGLYLHSDNLGGFGHHNSVLNCTFLNGQNSNGGDGRAIRIDSSDENIVASSIFQDNARLGAAEPNHIYDTAGLNTFIGNQFVSGRGTGLKLQGAHNIAIGNTFDGCNDHHIRVNGDKNRIIGNTFYNIGFNTTTNTRSGVFVDNISQTIIIGNMFNPYAGPPYPQYGIDLTSGPPTNTIVRDNTFATNVGQFTSGQIGASTGVGHSITNNVGITTINTKTANYTVNLADTEILGNASGGAFTVTLPTAIGNTGFKVTIKKTDSSANGLTIATILAQTIDGSASATISVPYTSLTLISDGSNWNII